MNQMNRGWADTGEKRGWWGWGEGNRSFIQDDRPFVWSRDLPTLKLCEYPKWKEQEKLSKTARFEICSLKIYGSLNLRNIKRICMGRSYSSSNFFPYKSSYRFRYLNCCHILYSDATDFKLGSPTYVFLLFLFLILTKCQVLNWRVGRSRDLVLQRAYSIQFNSRLLAATKSGWAKRVQFPERIYKWMYKS